MKQAILHLLALAGLVGNAGAAARFTTVYVQDRPIRVEIAETPEQHARGLMFRRCLPPDRGMLFVFADEDLRSFWMKNTLIPLDMIFINGDRQVVALHESVPPCRRDPCPGYESGAPARFVLELAGGTAQKLRLRLGDKIFIPID
jgi:uncharacterized membrane protein (UPF0127 family)